MYPTTTTTTTTTTTFALLMVLVAVAHGIAINKAELLTEPSSTAVSTNNGFAVQSGYEGYILNHQKPIANFNWLAASKLSILKNILVPVSSFLLVYGAKALGIIFHLMIALFLGVAATTAVCSFTPLCSIALAKPGLAFLKGQSVKDQVAEITRTYMTPENMDMVSKFVQSALDKYSITQRSEVQQVEPNVVENEAISK